jgi:hypothetical protein
MTEPTSSYLCVLHHQKAVSADVGLICHHHAASINETLQDILELFVTARALYLLPGSKPEGDGSAHIKQPDAPVPLNLGVAALSDGRAMGWDPDDNESGIPDVPGVLAVEADWVREARGLDPRTGPVTLAGEVNLLRAHRDWIYSQPEIVQYDKTLRGLRRAIIRETADPTPQRKPVGACPTKTGDGEDCGGPLWQDRYGAMSVDCGKCGVHFDESLLRHLGGMMAS